MATRTSRLLNRTLSSGKTKQKYQYQLYDYLKAIKNKPQSIGQELFENFNEKMDPIYL